jgi:hypothetical protein
MENKKRKEMLKLLTGEENIINPYEDILKILENPENYDSVRKIIERVIYKKKLEENILEKMIRERIYKLDEIIEKRESILKSSEDYSVQSYNAGSSNALRGEVEFLGLLLAEVEEL